MRQYARDAKQLAAETGVTLASGNAPLSEEKSRMG